MLWLTISGGLHPILQFFETSINYRHKERETKREIEGERDSIHVKKDKVGCFSADVKNLIEFRPH